MHLQVKKKGNLKQTITSTPNPTRHSNLRILLLLGGVVNCDRQRLHLRSPLTCSSSSSSAALNQQSIFSSSKLFIRVEPSSKFLAPESIEYSGGVSDEDSNF
ncbi:hypothetical protein HN51_047806 [Arachis hypogaea]|nr:uncharacterized protein DS421_12g370130 [Arachis hypogaea]